MKSVFEGALRFRPDTLEQYRAAGDGMPGGYGMEMFINGKEPYKMYSRLAQSPHFADKPLRLSCTRYERTGEGYA